MSQTQDIEQMLELYRSALFSRSHGPVARMRAIQYWRDSIVAEFKHRDDKIAELEARK